MPAPRAARCDGSVVLTVVRLKLILGTLTGGTGAARALESPLMPPPSRSSHTTGAPPEGIRGGAGDWARRCGEASCAVAAGRRLRHARTHAPCWRLHDA
jgi:hypothetical protein